MAGSQLSQLLTLVNYTTCFSSLEKQQSHLTFVGWSVASKVFSSSSSLLILATTGYREDILITESALNKRRLVFRVVK